MRMMYGLASQGVGSHVYFHDLGFLDECLRQGRVHPQQMDPPGSSVAGSTFRATTARGDRTLDLSKTTGGWGWGEQLSGSGPALGAGVACTQEPLHDKWVLGGFVHGSGEATH